jgi:type IV pilus assembly protein PilN
MRLKLNLASQTYVNRRALYLFYAVGTALLILILITQLRYLLQLRAQEQMLTQRVTEIQDKLGISNETVTTYSDEELKRLMEKIEFSNNVIMKDSFHWTGLLSLLEEMLPANVRILDIRPDFKSSTLNLSAQAKTVKEMQLLIDRLMAEGTFSDVLLLSQAEQEKTNEPLSQEPVIVFNLKFKWVLQ